MHSQYNWVTTDICAVVTTISTSPLFHFPRRHSDDDGHRQFREHLLRVRHVFLHGGADHADRLHDPHLTIARQLPAALHGLRLRHAALVGAARREPTR